MVTRSTSSASHLKVVSSVHRALTPDFRTSPAELNLQISRYSSVSLMDSNERRLDTAKVIDQVAQLTFDHRQLIEIREELTTGTH